jgi:hypothetical protein
MWDLVEEAKHWQPSIHPPLTYNSGWDEDVYPENEGEVYGEELTMEVSKGSSGSNTQVSIADEEERDSESDSYN